MRSFLKKILVLATVVAVVAFVAVVAVVAVIGLSCFLPEIASALKCICQL